MEISKAIEDVIKERERQDNHWGVNGHNSFIWLALIGEEYGELCTEVLENKFKITSNGEILRYLKERTRDEAVQLAAITVAFIEYLDGGTM